MDKLLYRVNRSAVLWSWGLSGLRLGSGLILLPVLLHVLPKADLGMYYLLLSLSALLPIIDFGFSVSIARYISYAMAGATDLKARGYEILEHPAPPNYPLLWQLMETTRKLCRLLSLAAIVVLGIVGTWAVGLRVHETSAPQLAWIAWVITLVSGVFEIYTGWWNVFLRGMNEVVYSSRIAVIAYSVKLVLACVLLLAGAGLLAIPIAGIVSGIIQRTLARDAVLRLLPSDVARTAKGSLLAVLWPNSWRVGLQFFTVYLSTHANAILCSKYFGLGANAQYGLSLQIAQVLAGMAAVWIAVKWPLVGQYRTQQNYGGLERLLAPRLTLQNLTYIVLAFAAFLAGPALLRWHGGGKELLPPLWFGLMLFMLFLDMQFSFWTTLLSTENHIPSLWPTVVTNLASLLLVLILLETTSLKLGAFVLAPLLAGCVFSYWFWPIAGARSLRTGWFRFMFTPQAVQFLKPH